MRKLTVALAIMAAGGSARAVDFSLEYMSVPAVWQFVQSDLAESPVTPRQMSNEMGLGVFGLRFGQNLPPLFEGWP